MGDAGARRIMLDFARRTGLTNQDRPPRRYLWTDAFAVCTLLGLSVEEDDEDMLRLALRLVDQTHHVLGRHRPDDERSGWISGLSEDEGEAHPTRGGLRIGKALPERTPDETADPALEWDRDGQYFHYLTRWMHALERVAQVTGNRTYHRYACELARAACTGFVHATPTGTRRLVWKMSIDLGRPQVSSSGQHDPLDGYLTCWELQAANAGDVELDLGAEIRELAGLCAGRSWDTHDPLGVGGLLCDAHRLDRLVRSGAKGETASWESLLESILDSSLRGLDRLVAQGVLDGPADQRLAFRELGLSIGLHAVERLAPPGTEGAPAGEGHPAGAAGRAGGVLRELSRYRPLADRIEALWLEPASRETRLWREHRDIDDGMLATSLAPDGYLAVGGD